MLDSGIGGAYAKSAWLDGKLAMVAGELKIESLKAADAPEVTDMIRRNLAYFQEHGSVLASISRRLVDLFSTYDREGSRFYIARDHSKGGLIVGGAGIGSFQGLPVSEGVAEIRDLVVEPPYRGAGLGNKLLNRCLDEAVALGYKRAYLETTPEMKHAQKLFVRTGFRPVGIEQGKAAGSTEVPCYFVREELQSLAK